MLIRKLSKKKVSTLNACTSLAIIIDCKYILYSSTTILFIINAIIYTFVSALQQVLEYNVSKGNKGLLRYLYKTMPIFLSTKRLPDRIVLAEYILNRMQKLIHTSISHLCRYDSTHTRTHVCTLFQKRTHRAAD